MRPSTRLVAAFSVALGLSACVEPRTEVIVRVDSELPWGEGQRVQSVVVEVRRGGSSGALRSVRTSTLGAGANRASLPLFLGARESTGDVAVPLWVEALGCSEPNGCDRDTAVVAQRALVLFQRDQTVELPLLLASACAGVTCSVDQRCAPTTGACESANSAPVRPFVGVSASVDVPVVEDDVPVVQSDAPTVDVTDAGAIDVAADLVDAGPTDTGPVDSGPIDTGVRDAGAIDVGLRDAGAIDGGLRDAGAIDGGLRDAGAIDVGLRDAGTPTCPTGMVLIPAGGFDMGSTTGDADERPVHRVDLSAYCIDRNEITVADYQTCYTASGSGCTAPGTGGACNWIVGTRLSHPINCVTWTQARTFCQWRGGDLPTEAQWEYAARGSDGRTYPWGNAAPASQLCWSGGGTSRTGTCALGMFPSGDSPFGLRDMAGNVWEWTANWSGVYPARSVADPVGPSTGTSRVMRGGNWGYTNAHYMRATYRNYQPESFSHITVGFRCAAQVTRR